MKKFFKHNFNIDKIVFSCYVPKGAGETVHMNRPSHGLALHLSGEKKYIFEGKKVLYTKKNDIIFMPECSNYIVESVCPGDCYAINFKISDNALFEPFVLNAGSIVTDKFKSAERAFRLKPNGYEMQCKADLYSVICAMLKEYEKKYIPKNTERIIEPAIEYIHRKYASENINVEHLASMCGISSVYLRKIFLKNKNLSPIQYINSLKLERAKELIMSGFYTVSEVSEMSGFANESYFCRYFFCRYFKKNIGMTPSEYRNNAEDLL